MPPVIVTYDSPSKRYIGYREGIPDVQDTVSDADVDAFAEREQRAAFEAGEDTAAARWASEYHDPPQEYVRRDFGTFTPPSHQSVRERLAKELLEPKLPVQPPAPRSRPRPE